MPELPNIELEGFFGPVGAAREKTARQSLETILQWLSTQMPLEKAGVDTVIYNPVDRRGRFGVQRIGNKTVRMVQVGGRYGGSWARRSGPSMAGVLAHEFQHALEYDQDAWKQLSARRAVLDAVNNAPKALKTRVYKRSVGELGANKRLMEVVRAARKSPVIRKIAPFALLLAVLGGGAAMLGGRDDSA